jgi:hypothetical protein
MAPSLAGVLRYATHFRGFTRHPVPSGGIDRDQRIKCVEPNICAIATWAGALISIAKKLKVKAACGPREGALKGIADGATLVIPFFGGT